MRVLLLSGLGPANLNQPYLDGSLFVQGRDERVGEILRRAQAPDLDLGQLSFTQSDTRYALLRRQSTEAPHLTSVTLLSILGASGHSFDRVDLADVWAGRATAPATDVDLALLSTTFIWNASILTAAVRWVEENLPGTPIVVGGQYTNLKYMTVLRDHPTIAAVVRGDAEDALPRALDAFERRADLGGVPNLVWRRDGAIRVNSIEYVDIDQFPSPAVSGHAEVMPYESMRGCPFDCKFCSFPAASPKWRYKSAEKIRNDWISYAEANGCESMYAMDSTFTVPPTRLRRLLEILPGSATPKWEAFSRANTLNSPEVVDGLADSRCFQLHVGFESMNDANLKRMSKRVTARQNRRAVELLQESNISLYGLFIVGYPGETPEMYQDTQDYLLHEYSGRFALSRFTITDETMPLWQDREALRIETPDLSDPFAPWSHIGMDSVTASRLYKETADRVRQVNDRAVLNLWQHDYQTRLMPRRDLPTNLAAEKCVERMAMAPVDFPDLDQAAAAIRDNLDRLRELGVGLTPHKRELTGQPA